MTTVKFGAEIYPWSYYLTACTNQARIALLHLNRLWAMEGSPPDVDVWTRRVPGSDIEVWAELQGFVTAGVILGRLLAPNPIPPRNEPNREALKRQAHARGRRLRDLLDIEGDSPLLSIAAVRNGMEHVDERIDKIVVDEDVWSVSDWYISNEVYVASTNRQEAADQGAEGRHVNMRVFAPLPGILIFDEHHIDLFAFEVALHNLWAGMTLAQQRILKDAPSGRHGYGSAKMRRWPVELWETRRQEIERVRIDIRDDGRSGWVIEEPASVVLVLSGEGDG